MRSVLRASALSVGLFAIVSTNLFGQPNPDAKQLISSLSGTWKEDSSKRKIGSAAGLRFRSSASGGLEELRGPETRPMVQPVKLDGTPYGMEGGNSMIWKQIDANTFERRTARDGKVMSIRRIRISSDGQTLTEDSDRFSLDGKSQKRTAEYRRASGDFKGLLGSWNLVKAQDSVPFEVKYEAAGPNAMKVINPLGQTYTLSFDGKPSPITGANVIPGMMISGRAIDGNTFETTTTREGVLGNKSRVVLSGGGKVMTVTSQGMGPESSREPSVAVFNKQ